jgi:hypothetical protein
VPAPLERAAENERVLGGDALVDVTDEVVAATPKPNPDDDGLLLGLVAVFFFLAKKSAVLERGETAGDGILFRIKAWEGISEPVIRKATPRR